MNNNFGGLPAHMDDNQKIVLRDNMKQKRAQNPRNLEKVEKGGLSMF